MLRRVSELQGCRVLALDGEVGKVRDAYVDEQSWRVRYLILETGRWLSRRNVLINPRSVALFDSTLHTVSVSLSCALIESSPRLDLAKRLSRHDARHLDRYYGYSNDWTRPVPWATGPTPPAMVPIGSDSSLPEEPSRPDSVPTETHLQSLQGMLDFTLLTLDGQIGAIKDVYFDDETWALRYLIVQTGSWLLGRRVLLGIDQASRVDWALQTIEVDQSREQIAHGQEFDPDHPPPGDLQVALPASRVDAERQ